MPRCADGAATVLMRSLEILPLPRRFLLDALGTSSTCSSVLDSWRPSGCVTTVVLRVTLRPSGPIVEEVDTDRVIPRPPVLVDVKELEVCCEKPRCSGKRCAAAW